MARLYKSYDFGFWETVCGTKLDVCTLRWSFCDHMQTVAGDKTNPCIYNMYKCFDVSPRGNPNLPKTLRQTSLRLPLKTQDDCREPAA